MSKFDWFLLFSIPIQVNQKDVIKDVIKDVSKEFSKEALKVVLKGALKRKSLAGV